jgi:hypothetical protein
MLVWKLTYALMGFSKENHDKIFHEKILNKLKYVNDVHQPNKNSFKKNLIV